jgi:hypothetical protein
MAQYWKLRLIENKAHRIHVSQRLRALRIQMKEQVTDVTNEHDLRLATWNLMHFGNGGGYWRDIDALLYIAEIIDHFDLVALQEINTNLEQLKELMKNYLGPEWDYIVTDTTGGSLGNDERMAYVYRKGKVRFSRLAGEIVLPDGQTIVGESGVTHTDNFKTHHQFARSPFVVGFQCGWFDFKLATVHIYFGNPPKQPDDMSDADYTQLKADYMTIRKTEIRELAEYLADRQKSERRAELKILKGKGWDTEQSTANYILLGDFNIVSPEHETMLALKESGFEIPAGMEELPTTLGKTKAFYDQIAHRLGDKRVQHHLSGAINFRESVFRKEDAQHYIDIVKDRHVTGEAKNIDRTREKQIKYFNLYRFKHQMSDHQLLWSAFKVDLAERYLERIEIEAETS